MSDVLVIEVEGAAQDGAMVGFEYTATGMRFEIKGALAKALNAEITRLEGLLKKALETANAD